MSKETHRLVVKKVHQWGAPISTISHAGMGEPLTDKGLEEKIALEKELFPDAEVVVYTNAGLLTEHRARMLLDCGLNRVSVSLNARRKSTYEAVVGIPYERTIENVLALLDLVRKLRANVLVQVSLVPLTIHSTDEIKEFQEFWRDKVDSVVVPPWISWGNHFGKSRTLTQWPCRYIWEVFQVDWDATVAMCCEDYDTKYPLGNLKEHSPGEIFNSIRMHNQRVNQLNGSFAWPEICRNCAETLGVARSFWQTATTIPSDGWHSSK